MSRPKKFIYTLSGKKNCTFIFAITVKLHRILIIFGTQILK